jgi:hypothetical protein
MEFTSEEIEYLLRKAADVPPDNCCEVDGVSEDGVTLTWTVSGYEEQPTKELILSPQSDRKEL